MILEKVEAAALPARWDALVIHPATVEVVVHPPVPTEGWTLASLDRHIADVRALYQATLES